MKKRLQNILAHAGIASRRTSGELIEKGKVKIDGKVVVEKGLKLDPGEHKITVSGEAIGEEKKYYFLLNKPAGFVSTVQDTHNRRKIVDIFEGINARLYPVGRLDKDTTGAIIITNDGDLTNRLTHPKYEVEKEYRVFTAPPLKDRDLETLRRGIVLEDGKTSPCEIERIKETADSGVYTFKLHEGKNRQIKRMCEAAGSTVKTLKRTKYAGLTVSGLREGEYRELSKREVKQLKEL
ncbi:MAG: pseudouridine synthase [Candidatus Omnitrophota bacterium]